MTQDRKSNARGMAVLTGMFSVLLVINLIHDRITDVLPNANPGRPGAIAAALLSLDFWIPAIEPLAYIAALLAVGHIFNRLARGNAFDEALNDGIRQMANALIFAAVAGCVLVPTFQAWQAGRMGGFPYRLETQDVAVGLIGIALNLVAAQVRRMKTQMEQFV